MASGHYFQTKKLKNMVVHIVRFANILLAALLAGTSFGIWMGFNPGHFSPSTYVEQQQNLVRSLNALMVALVILATVVTLASALLQRQNKPTFVALLLAAGFFVACILITRFGNVPIQKEMLQWNAAELPADWAVLRDNWWSFHIQRTVAELAALVLVAWTSAAKNTA